jgi:nucleoside-diphosphate-sugar epimerase
LKNPIASFEAIYGNDAADLLSLDLGSVKSVLVTGAQGMIGNALAETFLHTSRTGLDSRLQLYLVSRFWGEDARNYWSKFPNVKLLTNNELSYIGSVEYAIHTASPSNITKIDSLAELRDVNLGLAKSLLILNPKKVIYISTSEIYRGQDLEEGESSQDLSSNTKRDWYPIAKLETENYLNEIALSSEFHLVNVRLFHTFGPGLKKNDGRAFADFIWGAVEKGKIVLNSDGSQIRSFLYLSDAVNAIIKLMLGKTPNIYLVNLGSTNPLSILNFAREISDVTGASLEFEHIENFQHSMNDRLIPKIERMLEWDWKPTVDLSSAIQLTANWIKQSAQFQKEK